MNWKVGKRWQWPLLHLFWWCNLSPVPKAYLKQKRVEYRGIALPHSLPHWTSCHWVCLFPEDFWQSAPPVNIAVGNFQALVCISLAQSGLLRWWVAKMWRGGAHPRELVWPSGAREHCTQLCAQCSNQLFTQTATSPAAGRLQRWQYCIALTLVLGPELGRKGET